MRRRPRFSRPASQIIDDVLAGTGIAINQLTTQLDAFSPGSAAQYIPSAALAISKTNELRTLFQEIAVNPTPQEQQMLDTFASMLENANIPVLLAATTRTAGTDVLQPLGLCDNLSQFNAITAGVGAVGAALMALGLVTGANPLILGAGVVLVGLAAGAAIGSGIACWDYAPPPPGCGPAPSGSGAGTTGMGAAPPSGGSGCGNAAGGGGGGLQVAAADGAQGSRYVVKIFSPDGKTRLTPFTGATDPGGYFYIPIIPAGEPFKAVATDRWTGAAATFNGTGPALGEMTMMFFDFADVQQNLYNIAIGDTISNGVPAPGAGNIETPGGLDVYHFNAAAGQVVYFDVQQVDNSLGAVGWQLLAPDNQPVFDTCLGCGDVGVKTLTLGGRYTLLVGNDTDPVTGTYRFKLWPVPPPQQFAIAVGDTISNGVPGPGAGKIETPGVRDIYRFNAAAGQQVFVDVQDVANSVAGVQLELVDATGDPVFKSCLGCSNPGFSCSLTVASIRSPVGADRDDGVGAYRFKLWPVPAPQQFAIAVGDTISTVCPALARATSRRPGCAISTASTQLPANRFSWTCNACE